MIGRSGALLLLAIGCQQEIIPDPGPAHQDELLFRHYEARTQEQQELLVQQGPPAYVTQAPDLVPGARCWIYVDPQGQGQASYCWDPWGRLLRQRIRPPAPPEPAAALPPPPVAPQARPMPAPPPAAHAAPPPETPAAPPAPARKSTAGVREGTCYSDSECGGGSCRGGKCTTAGGTCYSDSECPGGTCRGGKCTTAGGTCYSDSECGGGVCRSGKCTTAGGTCYSDSECPGGSCRSGHCT